jgi:hypothetical protein
MAEYLSGFSLDSLVVPVKAATIYTAQERSLFLSGTLVPIITVPAGSASAQVPLLGDVTATTYSDDSATADLTALQITDTKNTIPVNIYAARSVLRDAHGIDPNEIGRVLGNAVAKAFDTAVLTAMAADLDEGVDAEPITVNTIFDNIAEIRGNGEMGQLYGILSTASAAALMKEIGTNAYAGGDFQTEALRNGFVGMLGGVMMFQSAYVPAAHNGFIFGQDAARIAMQKNVDIEVQRRAAAVGNDVVASLHAGFGVVDGSRGVQLIDV